MTVNTRIVNDMVERNFELLVGYCKRLIDIESVTGHEYDVQQEVRSIMSEIGMEVDYWIPNDEEMRRSELFSETGESFENRPVVAGVIKGTQGKSILINGHVDVVNEFPIEKWTTNPFQSVMRDGKLYGRGASDMKTGVATALFAVKLIKELGIEHGDITVVSVPGEENGGNGTVASLLRGYTQADAAIFPEPTSNQIQPAHRGAAFWRVHIEGKASHGGTKYKGVSAIEKGMEIAENLKELEIWRNETICSKHPMYKGYPLSAPVTLGMFNGGQFTSGVPEACTLEGCIEYVPGEKSADVRKQFEAAVMKICQTDSWMQEHPPKVEWFGLLYEPAETDSSHEFVRLAEKCYEEMTNEKPVVNGFEAGTDMRLMANKYGIPGIMFGAGDIAMAHAPNEYVDLEALKKNAKVMTMLIAQWCGTNK